MNTTVIGVTHKVSNFGLAAYQLDQSTAQRIGIEISPDWEETYAQIYEQNLTDNIVAATIVEKIIELSKDDERIIRQLARSQKWPKELTDYVVSELRKNREEQGIMAKKLRDNIASKFDKKFVFDLINGNLYFYYLYKRIRQQGRTPIFLDIKGPTYCRFKVVADISEALGKLRNFPPTFNKAIHQFSVKETKAVVAIREPQMAYQIVKNGVELSFVGGAHISGCNNVGTILRQKGIKVKTRNHSTYPRDPTSRVYSTRRLREYTRTRRQYLERLKRTHDAWWKRLEAKRAHLK